MKNKEKNIQILRQGGIGILPTDTLYGLVGKALNEETVERIYKVRRRNPQKPLIILIAELKDLEKFGVKINSDVEEKLSKIWPASVSIVLPCENEELDYLHRGTKTLAFRLTSDNELNDIIKIGPLVAPSANFEGQEPARTIDEAVKYFDKEVDFYEDAGKLEGEPSTLIKVDESGNMEILREGADLERVKKILNS